MNEGALVSQLMYNKEPLSPREIMKALIDGEKLKIMTAPKGFNFWLQDGQLVSNKITYLKGIPMSWFNPDIHYEVDYND